MLTDKRTIGFRLEVIVEPDETGFHAYCPALKGLHTCGNTEEEALKNVSDACKAYLLSLIKHGDPIPVGIVVHNEIEPTPHLTVGHHIGHKESLTVACTI